MQYEKYELILKHYISEEGEKNILVDDPIVCTYTTCFGVPVCKNGVADKLYRKLLEQLESQINI